MFLLRTNLLVFGLFISYVDCQSLPTSFSVAKASNKFGVDLFRILAAKDGSNLKNVFFSPISLSTVLAMTSLGARGDTATEMAKTLHWDGIPAEQLHNAMKAFLGTISQLNDGKNKLLTANSLFVQQGLEIAQFKSQTAMFYGATVAEVDYKTNPGAARSRVNRWVEQQTRNKIKNVIPEGGFDANTKLVLVNAIYFKGLWEKTFDKQQTHSGPFLNSLGKKVDTQMMKIVGDFRMYSNEKLSLQTIELFYKDKNCSMFILLPNTPNGLPDLEKVLTSELLETTVAATKKTSLKKEVHVTIPKFTITKSFELSEVLKDLGAGKMFSGEADFSGITRAEKLHVSQVIHKALVEVNEEGTVAAAASVVQISRMAAVLPEYEFVADHPFLFLITENSANSILFMGRFANPGGL